MREQALKKMDGGWSMDREKGVEYKLLNELFTRMQYEQTVLMFGNKYRKINTSVLDYAWNLVVTTTAN